MSKSEDGLTDEVRALKTLAKMAPGDLVETEAFENLNDQDQKDVLFLRESRLRHRRFHRFWNEYKPEQRAWIRSQKIYEQMAAFGRWREFTGQAKKFWIEIVQLLEVLIRKLVFWR